MSAHKAVGRTSRPQPAASTDVVLRAAGDLRTIRSRGLRLVLKMLSWGTLIVSLAVLFPGNIFHAHGPELFGTGVLTVAIVLFAFQSLLELVPETLQALWRRKLLLPKLETTETASMEAEPQTLEPTALADQYLQYLKDMEALLNQRSWQVGMIVVFELIVNLWLGFLNPGFLNRLFQGSLGWVRLAELVIDMTLAALIAPLAWRLIVIGLQIWRLPERFDIRVQFEHPDRCGGLEPLGNLCLWNILIVSLPLVYLGGWLLIARSNTSGFGFYATDGWQFILAQAEAYANLFADLLWILIPFTIVGFVLPLWNTHRVMVEKRKSLLVQLDERIENITNEWNSAMEQIGTFSVGEENEKLGRLDFAAQIYQRQKRVPVWPINWNIFLKFASTQIIPFFSLTGLGPGLIKILSFLLNLLSAQPS